MKAAQFSEVASLAKSNACLTDADDSILFGCGLSDFQAPVFVSVRMAAKFVRWHALQFNGEWDSEALNECAQIFRRKVQLV